MKESYNREELEQQILYKMAEIRRLVIDATGSCGYLSMCIHDTHMTANNRYWQEDSDNPISTCTFEFDTYDTTQHPIDENIAVTLAYMGNELRKCHTSLERAIKRNAPCNDIKNLESKIHHYTVACEMLKRSMM